MIRAASTNDLPRIAEIHALAWTKAYRELLAPEILAGISPESRLKQWQQWLTFSEQSVHVLESEGMVVGYSLVGPPQSHANGYANFGELLHLYQDNAMIGTGIGHQLYEHAVRFLVEAGKEGMLLWILEQNNRARRFYEQHCMRTDGGRRDEPSWLGKGVFEVRYVLHFNSCRQTERKTSSLSD